VLIALLCVRYLTLPFYAGINLKTTSKEEKQEKVQKSQKDQFTRLQLAVASSKGEQEAGRPISTPSTRRGEQETHNGE
jgi:hypothetical protein